jgi:hypothetical protein
MKTVVTPKIAKPFGPQINTAKATKTASTVPQETESLG